MAEAEGQPGHHEEMKALAQYALWYHSFSQLSYQWLEQNEHGGVESRLAHLIGKCTWLPLTNRKKIWLAWKYDYADQHSRSSYSSSFYGLATNKRENLLGEVEVRGPLSWRLAIHDVQAISKKRVVFHNSNSIADRDQERDPELRMPWKVAGSRWEPA